MRNVVGKSLSFLKWIMPCLSSIIQVQVEMRQVYIRLALKHHIPLEHDSNRVVPCQACVRRGCAALCPNGDSYPLSIRGSLT